MSVVLAFDQSSKKTGWSYFEDKKYVSSGVIDKHNISDTNTRIGEMGVAICKQINKMKPDVVILEDVQAQSGVSTVISLARLQGFILGWCYVHDVAVKIIKPSEWRKEIHIKQGAGVKRAELKAQSIDFVKTTYGVTLSEDESEAICQNVAAHIKYNL